jgi:hypothetical protein
MRFWPDSDLGGMPLSGGRVVLVNQAAEYVDPFHSRQFGRPCNGGQDAGRSGWLQVERNFGIPVADEEPEPVGTLVEIYQQVAGLLGDPCSGGAAVMPAVACGAGRPRNSLLEIE